MAGTGLLLHTESLKTFPHDDAHRACAQHRSAPHLLAEALIRLENGTHVRPFDGNGNPQVYLPSKVATGLPTVSRSIVSQGDILKFLTDLGISEPDLVDDVIKNVLPKYRQNHSGLKSIGGNEHLDDVERILDALSPESVSRSLSKVQGLRNTLRNLPFLLCGNAANAKDIRYVIPDNVYLPSPELQRFFAGNPNAWFLSALYDRVPEMTSRLGLNQAVKVTVAPPQSSGHVRLKSNHGDHERGLNEFDPNCTVDGLDHALRHIDMAKSEFVWNQLLPRLTNQIHGTVERSSRQYFEHSTRTQMRSKLGNMLMETPWVPSPNGVFVLPKDITQEQLPEQFIPNDQLAATLGMNQRLLLFAEELGLPLEVLRTIQDHAKEIEEYARRLQKKAVADSKRLPKPGLTPTDEIAHNLQERFTRPAAADTVANGRTAGPLKNPELRRARVSQEILQARHDEPTLDMRTRTVVTKDWEAKNPQVRSFLKEEYAGKCQICSDSFPKRDGETYFECVYLERHIAARWIDRPGNVMCLCASCSAKFEHGSVEIDRDIFMLVLALDDQRHTDDLKILLCGDRVSITYSQRHLIDLQAIARELAGR
ncbi:MAG: hypothetical protein H0T72_05100 [Chloroflexia bacterium]|nr:hypothetical protein [Chloroflexia bacterium]